MASKTQVEVRPQHMFDIARFEAYLRSNAHLLLPVSTSSPDNVQLNLLSVKQFKVGQSNPSFLLEIRFLNNVVTPSDWKYVLRKKPPGKLLPSAHQVRFF